VAALARRWAPTRDQLVGTVLTAAAIAYGICGSSWYYLEGTASQKSNGVYGFSPFPESLPVGAYLARHADTDDKVFVFGSEPQVLYYAGRKSASRYIFMYPVMMRTPDALERQREVVRELTDRPPRWIVTVALNGSFEAGPFDRDSEPTTFLQDEVIRMLSHEYRLVGTVHKDETEVQPFDGEVPEHQVLLPPVGHVLTVWKRRDAVAP
jgi:hypothetical protein